MRQVYSHSWWHLLAWLCVPLTWIVATAGCQRSQTAAQGQAQSGAVARVAASNSYLEAMVLDLLGPDTGIVRLAEPGTCPGHFDIRPSQMTALRNCRVLLRFDFQRSLDAKLSGVASEGLTIVEVKVPGGMCEPDSYLAAGEQVKDGLVSAGLIDQASADQRMQSIRARLAETAARCQRQVKEAGLAEKAVLTSNHQAAFCRWLGLQVAATFSGADVASVEQVQTAIRGGEQAGVIGVVANLPEGRRVADALAKRLNAKVVVFGNFPQIQGDGPAFDALILGNVAELVKVLQP
ncbi:MAG TPA: zinc ABC transporter substrate-binding protein [Phycisphaerae bacterium]|jgi:zinc transport system substrate-binding protein|nr:zinc ABC transporter substrate-binding protein [Phycisphaerae bacterium]HOB74250.1 zinc ABC transporter substrate-binding protein [Phycisphaerae bacterium]HPU32132.1 zinc ABC transporter substrate-binding protein [Phycisphaerae bacterium]HQE42181.1 zinc ABC transporter substrate-binding protein [Phycisphaerae bacterium]HXK87026.1 zinc ABC transporter substrate-binding protein [Phycisphaerae bacterium]